MSLIDVIFEELRQKGAIPFVDFMQQVLYTPNLGYYSKAQEIFGTKGDFITAPLLTPLFGKTIANQCQQILSACSAPILFEFGAGTGDLCVALLSALEELGALPLQYHILEVSGHLKKQQQQLIQLKLPHLFERVKWLSAWPVEPFEGVVIANEVLDAMPVHRFLKLENEILESYVTLDENNTLIEEFKPTSDERLLAYVAKALPASLQPYLGEANLFLDDWFRQCYDMLSQGAMFIIDYGFPRHEYYHPDRHQGTLMCHHRHQAHTNPLINLGDQDITAHVDFTAVAEAAFDAGFHVAGFTNQASFLLANGLLSLVEQEENPHEHLKTLQALRLLLEPSEMGELFKVLALTKNVQQSLNGFQLQDKRASL
jgi:SAM-dependent MidA family methyltransferase